MVKWTYHKCKELETCSLTTDLEPVIYCATNHLLARIYFDSNTQDAKKTQVYLSNFYSFPCFTYEQLCNIETFFVIWRHVNLKVLVPENITESGIMEMKTDISKQNKMTSEWP